MKKRLFPWHVYIQKLLRHKALRPKDIPKELKEKFKLEISISLSTLYPTLRRMHGWGLLKQFKDGRYADFEYKEIEGEIKIAVQRLEEKFLRPPTLEELILEIRESPENADVRNKVYEIALTMGRKPPTLEDVEEGQEKAYILLTTAKWLRIKEGKDKELKEYLEKSPDILPQESHYAVTRKAEEYAKKYYNFLPEIKISPRTIGGEMKYWSYVYLWPKEAREVIGRVDEEGKKSVEWRDWDVEDDSITKIR